MIVDGQGVIGRIDGGIELVTGADRKSLPHEWRAVRQEGCAREFDQDYLQFTSDVKGYEVNPLFAYAVFRSRGVGRC